MTVMRAKHHYPLVELPVEGMDIVRGTGVHYRRDGYLSPAAKRLIEILKEQGRAISASQVKSKQVIRSQARET